MDESLLNDHFSNPTLMRTARGAYASAIRAQLHAAGIEDLPRNGAFILLGIESGGGPRVDLPSTLGVSKQAVSQLLDTLVNRGYLERSTDATDRRRIALDLTERGRQAADACLRGVEAVNRQLYEKIQPEQVAAMRTALLALSEIKVSDAEKGTGKPRPLRQFRRFSPVLPVRDLATALTHYETLGFKIVPYEKTDGYGFAWRDGMDLHFCVEEDQVASENRTSVYLYVRDADALYEEWSKPGLGGTTTAPEDTPWEMREGTHTDVDGNVIRFGSALSVPHQPSER
ncbi:MAG: MarR family transcriptional regulator [Acidimicrobiales bacterium]